MTTPKDGEVIRLPGWPAGLNNIAQETAVPKDALRQAVNVDISPEGKPSRRMGYELVVVGDAHSLFKHNGRMLAVVDGTLNAYDALYNPTPILDDFGPSPLTFAVCGRMLFWSDGLRIGRINDFFMAEPVWIAHTGQPSVTAIDSGGMFPGNYQVALTYMDPFGRESGSTLAVEVQVPANGGIRLANIPLVNATASTVRAYVTDSNSTELKWAADFPVGMPVWNLGATARGKRLQTQFLEPATPSTILRYQNGRMYGAHGKLLRWSPPLMYGLFHVQQDYTIYDGEISLLEPVGDGAQSGCYVGTDKCVYYMDGPAPDKWQKMVAYTSGAVLGTGLQVPAHLLGLPSTDPVPYWLAKNGQFCAGLPGGKVVPLTHGRFVAPQDAVSGATLLRETSELTQLITSLMGGVSNTMAATDSAVATIRKHGSED